MELNNLTNITSYQFNSTYEQIQLELFSPPVRALLVILFTTTAVFAFFSNVIVLIVCYYGTRTGKTLKVLLSNLAVIDILPVLFRNPLLYTDLLFGQWLFPTWMCPLTQFSYTIWKLVDVSIITLISVERLFGNFCLYSDMTMDRQ